MIKEKEPSISTVRETFLTVDDVLWFLYLYPLRILSAIGPRSVLYSFARLSWFRARRRRDAAARRMLKLRHAGIPHNEIPNIATKFLANSAVRMLDDLVVSWPSSPRRLRRCELRGLEHLERARSAGKGVILLTVHFCATRVAKQYLAKMGHAILTVRDQISEGDWWGRLGRRHLAPRRVKFLHAIMGESVDVQDPGFVLKIVGRLRSGGLVNIHFDGLAGARTVPWSFLGTRRNFSTGIFDIVRLSGCAVVPMICLGRSSDLRIHFRPHARHCADARTRRVYSGQPSGVCRDRRTTDREPPGGVGAMDEHLAAGADTMARIRKVFVVSLNLNAREEDLAYEQMLEEVAVLDSIAVLEFVTAVEREFGIKMEPENLDFDFLRDLSVLAAYIDQRVEALQATGGEGTAE